MGRRKKEEAILEAPVEMKEDAINLPENSDEKSAEKIASDAEASTFDSEPQNKYPIFKKIKSPSSAVNVRACANGEILFTIKNNSKIIVENEEDGWCKISGYVMAELVGELPS